MLGAPRFEEALRVSRRVHRELEDLHRICGGLVVENACCGDDGTADSPEGVVGGLGALRDDLALSFAFEDRGHLERQLPYLTNEIGSLHEARRALFLEICAIADRAEAQWTVQPESVARRFESFYSRILDYDDRQCELVLRVEYDEFGGGD